MVSVLLYTKEYEKGYWQALNDVLNLINTEETVLVDKKKFYKLVHSMRPRKSN